MAFALQTNAGHADPAIDSVETEFLGLINQYRQDNGRNPLGLNLQLNAAADWFACDMARDNYFSHFDNEDPPRNPGQRAAYFGYSGGVGENIAGGYPLATAQAVFQAWQNSPGHNAGMLNANFKVIGISRYYDANSSYGYYWVTDFGYGPSPGNPPTQQGDCGAGPIVTAAPGPTDGTPGPTVAPTPLPTPGGDGAAAVFLTRVQCAEPEYVRIKNYDDEPVSLSGFSLRSDPVNQQDFDLANILPSIGAGQEIELRSGPGATADPDNGVYVLTTDELFRDGDSTDFAYLVRPINSNVLGYCSKYTPAPTPVPTPTDTTQPTPTNAEVMTWADLDCNDYLSFLDPMAILEAAAGVAEPAGGGCPQIGADIVVIDHVWKWGDVNCSGAVNAKDAVDLLAYLGNLGVQGGVPSCPAPGTLF